MSEDYFHKILSNTATEAEKTDFYRLLDSNTEMREDYIQYKNLYIISKLNTSRYQSEQNESFAKFWNLTQPSRKINQWIRYAAIFVLATILGFMSDYFFNLKGNSTDQHIMYCSEKGSISTVFLEDGSVIWLSSGTKLILDKNSKGETVAKLNGEAFFDLIPNQNRKFEVDLGHFKIKDIGTKFNLRAYESEPLITTALVEGQIDMLNPEGKLFLSIKPGDFVDYNKTDEKISVVKQDPSIVTAWKDGKFVFIDKTLSDICKELENWYNVDIQIEDQKLANTRYTSVVKRSTTVKMVLKILAVTDQIKYEITDKKEGKDIIKIKK